MTKFTVNNRFIVEAYKTDKALRSNVKNAFATIDQKGRLQGLKVLIDTQIVLGQFIDRISAGSTIYVKEEILHNALWAKSALEAAGVDGQFIIVDLAHVDMIESAE